MLSRRLIPLLAALAPVMLHAQQQPHLPGPLNVWVVLPAAPVAPRVLTAGPATGSMPDQTAGSYGQTLGSFGQTAGSYGQTSGSYGQTLAGFGTSLDNLPTAAARANGTLPNPAGKPARSRLIDAFVVNSYRWEPARITYVDVLANELEARLADSGSAGPDVLIGTPLPLLWSFGEGALVQRYGLVTLSPTSVEEQMEELAALPKQRPQLAILLAAPHPETARAFVHWVLADGVCDRCSFRPGETDDPIAIGSASLRDVLSGTRPGGTDPDYAEADPRATQSIALGTSDPRLLEGLSVRVDVIDAHANERFAVLQLSATLEGRAAYGIVRALVVLRKDVGGHWRTLQVTPSLHLGQLNSASRTLADYTSHVRLEQVGKPLGIAQAAPVDGDLRPVRPYLGWENFGGATLQVVESQLRVGPSSKTGWLGSNLYFIPDTNQHLRTEVSARFASQIGDYRWRVWSIGKGGSLTLSPWKTLHIVSR